MFKNNDTVKVNAPVIQGTVIGGAFVDGSPNYLVEYTGKDGEVHQVYFPDDQLTGVPEEKEAEPTVA